MRRYEMVLVAAPVLNEEEVDQQITNFEQLIGEMGGQIHKVDRWGRRKLAYPVNKFTEGNYTLLLYDSEPDVEKEVLRRLKLSDHFIRFLSVRADHERIPTDEEKDALVEARKDHLRRAAERAAEAEAAQAAAAAGGGDKTDAGETEGDKAAPAEAAPAEAAAVDSEKATAPAEDAGDEAKAEAPDDETPDDETKAAAPDETSGEAEPSGDASAEDADDAKETSS